MQQERASGTHGTSLNARAKLVDAAGLADWLDVARSWVYGHADGLGALRLGSGPRAHLRFDLDVVRERLASCEGAEVEIASRAGTNDERSDDDVGGRSTVAAPVYEVTDIAGNAEEVDTRDLKPIP